MNLEFLDFSTDLFIKLILYNINKIFIQKSLYIENVEHLMYSWIFNLKVEFKY